MIETIPIKPFSNLVNYLLNRKQVFGITSLKELYVFFNGYGLSYTINNLSGDKDLEVFNEKFDWFVQEYFNEKTTEGWVSIINKTCNSNEESFDKFKEVFLLFKENNGF